MLMKMKVLDVVMKTFKMKEISMVRFEDMYVFVDLFTSHILN